MLEHSLLLLAQGGGWGYSQGSVEAIRFSPDQDILLGGYGLFGGRGSYNAEIRVSTKVQRPAFMLNPVRGFHVCDNSLNNLSISCNECLAKFWLQLLQWIFRFFVDTMN